MKRTKRADVRLRLMRVPDAENVVLCGKGSCFIRLEKFLVSINVLCADVKRLLDERGSFISFRQVIAVVIMTLSYRDELVYDTDDKAAE